MNRRVDDRIVLDLVKAEGRAGRIARLKRVKPWFSGFGFAIAITIVGLGVFFGHGPEAGMFVMLLVISFTLYLDIYANLMAAFEAAGIDFAER